MMKCECFYTNDLIQIHMLLDVCDVRCLQDFKVGLNFSVEIFLVFKPLKFVWNEETY